MRMLTFGLDWRASRRKPDVSGMHHVGLTPQRSQLGFRRWYKTSARCLMRDVRAAMRKTNSYSWSCSLCVCVKLAGARQPIFVPVLERRVSAWVKIGCLAPARSEEHTSELQSHLNLVCRLLLEKKKK